MTAENGKLETSIANRETEEDEKRNVVDTGVQYVV